MKFSIHACLRAISAVVAISFLAGCTTVVNLKYAGTVPRLANWATSVGTVEVDPYRGEFFRSSGLVMINSPTLSQNAHRELANSIKEAIRKRRLH